ncbi:MAG: tetratricopeptide repeat protein [Myxococcota bacterium]
MMLHRIRALACLVGLLAGMACAGTPSDDALVVSAADESRARSHQSVGTNHLREGRVALAIRELRAAEQLNPRDEWIQLTLAEAYRLKGLTAEAESHLLKALEIDPEFQSAHLTLSGLYIQMGRYEEAMTHAQLLEDDPTFPKPWQALTNKGWALMQLDRHKEARQALELALDYHDRYWRAQLNLGILDAEEGRRLDAMERFDRVLGLGPGPLARAEANFRMAEIYISLGNRDRAVEHLVAASAERPNGTWGKRSEDTLERLR